MRRSRALVWATEAEWLRDYIPLPIRERAARKVRRVKRRAARRWPT